MGVWDECVRDEAVTVSVQYGIQSCGLRDETERGRVVFVRVFAQVGQSHYVVCSFGSCRINTLLDVGVKILLAEIVDEVSRFVLIGERRGVGGCRGCGDSDEGHIRMAVADNFVGGIYRFHCTLVAEVAAYRACLQPFEESRLLFDAEVKLVVPQRYNVVSHLIHDIYDVFSLRYRTDQISLYKIST